MALRITQGMMYDSFRTGMNDSLSKMMELNKQSSSQLRINRLSDDAMGAGRLVSIRADLANMATYKDNITFAKGWLSTADSTLSGEGSVQDILVRLQELAEQGASGTYDKDNREQISFEVRQLYEQLIVAANTKFNGQHIFSGHKTDQPAYVAGLGVSCQDPGVNTKTMYVEGDARSTVLVQATSSGPADSATYRYSTDGGKTWNTAAVEDTLAPPYPAGKMRINAGGVGIVMDKADTVTAVDSTDENETDNGTWLYVHATAIYQGDDRNAQVVTPYGATTVTGTADGTFPRDVSVRIDSIENGTIKYSYSTDDGNNWLQLSAPDNGTSTRIPVPGGYLNLSDSPAVGEQFVIHPHRADIEYPIGENATVTVNLVGKDIFGGRYDNPDGPGYAVAEQEPNLFETVGRLLAYAETNSQQGMGEALADLKKVMNNVMTQNAIVGARYNRVDFSQTAMEMRQYATTELQSGIEDVDVLELTSQLASQEVAYSSVLKSSSMIMQMSLLNFI